MSDDEGGEKKSGYRLEYSNGRAKCKGPKPCQGTKIDKQELRLGSLVDFRGNTSYAWRHWGCTTGKIFENMKKTFDEADELDGFEELNDEDKEKVRTAWKEGHVADADIPESARKEGGGGDEEDDDEDGEEEKKPKKAAGKKAAEKAKKPESTVFKFEYAGSGRAKCKECTETIGKGFFRLGHETDFRGNKSFAWQHFGCTPTSRIAQLIQAYDKPTAVEGFDTLQDADKEKVQRAWDEGAIPEDDKGPGEPIEVAKKKAAPRKKKTDDDDDDDERPKKRARKAKVVDEDEDEEMEEDEKPKPKRAPAKKAVEKKEAPAKKRAPKKKKVEEKVEDGEDFGEELANVSGDDEEEAVPSEEEAPKKRKQRAPAKASTSKAAEKPAKAATKPASKATAKPPSKRAAAKPASSRGRSSRKAAEEDIDEDDDE